MLEGKAGYTKFMSFIKLGNRKSILCIHEKHLKISIFRKKAFSFYLLKL